jgi:hypothetical protein
MLATTLCAAVAGVLAHLRPEATHDRITLHRVIELNGETLLQQACDYTGRTEVPLQSSVGRTFPAQMATIGQAYACQRAVRSVKDVTPGELQRAMELLRLGAAARDMARQVKFVLAIPILQPATGYAGPSPVSAVLYIDSRSDNYWLNDVEVAAICRVLNETVRGFAGRTFERLQYVPLANFRTDSQVPSDLQADVLFALEVLQKVEPPGSEDAFEFNIDVTDLTALAFRQPRP